MNTKEKHEEKLLTCIDIPYFKNNPAYIDLWRSYYIQFKDPNILFLMYHKQISIYFHWIHIELSQYFLKKKQPQISQFILEEAIKNKVYDQERLKESLSQIPRFEKKYNRGHILALLNFKNIRCLGRIWNCYVEESFYLHNLQSCYNTFEEMKLVEYEKKYSEVPVKDEILETATWIFEKENSESNSNRFEIETSLKNHDLDGQTTEQDKIKNNQFYQEQQSEKSKKEVTTVPQEQMSNQNIVKNIDLLQKQLNKLNKLKNNKLNQEQLTVEDKTENVNINQEQITVENKTENVNINQLLSNGQNDLENNLKISDLRVNHMTESYNTENCTIDREQSCNIQNILNRELPNEENHRVISSVTQKDSNLQIENDSFEQDMNNFQIQNNNVSKTVINIKNSANQNNFDLNLPNHNKKLIDNQPQEDHTINEYEDDICNSSPLKDDSFDKDENLLSKKIKINDSFPTQSISTAIYEIKGELELGSELHINGYIYLVHSVEKNGYSLLKIAELENLTQTIIGKSSLLIRSEINSLDIANNVYKFDVCKHRSNFYVLFDFVLLCSLEPILINLPYKVKAFYLIKIVEKLIPLKERSVIISEILNFYIDQNFNLEFGSFILSYNFESLQKLKDAFPEFEIEISKEFLEILQEIISTQDAKKEILKHKTELLETL